jgi:hypothetical protein
LDDVWPAARGSIHNNCCRRSKKGGGGGGGHRCIMHRVHTSTL